MQKSLLSAVALLSFSSLWASSQPSSVDHRKTVCAITINSDNEINVMKKHFSPDYWKFIELAPQDSQVRDQISSGEQFLRPFCRPEIQCDVLVISGHYAGTFHGKDRLNLSLEEMEKMSCQSECSGIFQRPQEVFLFGCNTLSVPTSQGEIRQSIERLRRNGFSDIEARQLSGFYATLSDREMETRMRRVFSKTPRIYGFKNKAPLGEHIESPFENYLKSDLRNYNFPGSFQRDSGANQLILQSLGVMNLIQRAGMEISSQNLRPICDFKNQKLPLAQKIKLIHQLMNQKDLIPYIPEVGRFFEGLQTLDFQSPEFRSLKENHSFIELLQKISKIEMDEFILIRSKALQVLGQLGILTVADHMSGKTNLLGLGRRMTSFRAQMICGTEDRYPVSLKMIPDWQWQSQEFLNLLGCLNTPYIQVYQKLVGILADPSESQLRRLTAAAVFNRRGVTEPELQLAIAEELVKTSDPAFQQLLTGALQNSGKLVSPVKMKLAEIPLGRRNAKIQKLLQGL